MKFQTIMATILLGQFLEATIAKNCTTNDYGLRTDNPGNSCRDIYDKNPESRGNSGEYIIKSDRLHFVHCDMELDCKGHKGWMRIADLNTTRGDDCPNGWVKNAAYKSLCMGSPPANCYSTIFSTVATRYTKVCGKAKSYQTGSMDAFYPHAHANGDLSVYTPDVTVSRSLDGLYVDGISITTAKPRKHIWTYAVGTSDNDGNYKTNCPCAVHPGPSPPTFVGNDYYCESGNTDSYQGDKLYSGDPLWDGSQCSSENSCCSRADMPWFFRHFITKQQANIEVRMCKDQGFVDEGLGVEQLQLYVQ